MWHLRYVALHYVATSEKHWLINYIDIKSKCCHIKKLTCKGSLQQMFIRAYQSHVGIFDPALWTIAPLTYSLLHLSPPSTLPCVNKNTVYTIQYTCIHVKEWDLSRFENIHRKKKLFDIPVPSRMSLTKLSLGGNYDVIYKIFLPR